MRDETKKLIFLMIFAIAMKRVELVVVVYSRKL